MSGITIRGLRPGDESAWRGIWDEYLTFYEVTLTPEVTAHTWARLMDPASPLKGRVGLRDGQVLGFALYLTHGSTWVIGEDCYLEDLCVTSDARGSGIGRALIEDLVTLGRQQGWNRLYWHTSETNKRAQALYDSFVKSDGHLRYRLTL
ncbi:GNAT family N-acetyltransferase [Xinfangfangia sp. D13-10-4-6]|uniref:GNAT family N-acetyltransferase n=1 Tax=Pseudogemmobacter hezensis TaxID=2737662 RepID=UPI0015571F62|nr:GNAT family N-acetyltransferase [Pseudogemmobacter hezensis]NPD16144.1 GNAT family N-acetyltransferase [Pseudogemmobacter hezensis]